MIEKIKGKELNTAIEKELIRMCDEGFEQSIRI